MFCELNAHSYYSFLDGVDSPLELAQQAKALGMKALALTDRDGFYGVIPFFYACKHFGIKPLVGIQVKVDDADDLVLLCQNNEGYRKVSRMLTDAYTIGDKGSPKVQRHHLLALGSDVIALFLSDMDLEKLRGYQSLFERENFYVALTHHFDLGDKRRMFERAGVAKSAGVPLVATNSPRYATKSQAKLYDVLVCIKEGCLLSRSHAKRPGNHHRYLKEDAEIRELFSSYPEVVENTAHIAKRCSVTLDFSAYRLPEVGVEDADRELASLCWKAVGEQALTEEKREKVVKRLEFELRVIEKKGLSGYFLMVWDIVQFARINQIPVQGRGSAANSLVAYLLRITPVDPIDNHLFFGRFINEEMETVPDIDLDFAATRDANEMDREDVIQYVYEKYGHDYVAMVCTFVTFQPRSAIREVGKVMEMPEEAIDAMARFSSHYMSCEDAIEDLAANEAFREHFLTKAWRDFGQMVQAIGHLPRHLSIHVGGMLIAATPIADMVPLEPATMKGRVVCQWDKDMVEDAGLIKVDILSLGMLAVLREASKMAQVELDQVPPEDPKVYEMIAAADTVGVFQVESRAQMQSLPRTKPKNSSELGVQLAIIRPGPLQGNMVLPYILRKQGKEPVSYIHPKLKPILEDTLGVILFQEQVLQVAVAIANFSPGQAEVLRRAMSRKRSQEAMEAIKQAFFKGASDNGVDEKVAGDVFSALQGFALYGFCKSHALSFAKITYLSAWLKKYHPAAFSAALINNQPMGFYSTETLLEEAKRHGVAVFPVDVNRSRERCFLERGGIRLGFNQVKGVGDGLASGIVERAPFSSMRDFYRKMRCKPRVVENLVRAGAFDSLGLERRQLLWQFWLLKGSNSEPMLFEEAQSVPSLPKEHLEDFVRGEWEVMGYSPHTHPMSLLRPHLSKQVSLSSSLTLISDGHPVTVSGMMICKQKPPTAKGFVFLTLEDEKGMINVIISPPLYKARRSLIKSTLFPIVHGTLQRKEGVVNVYASEVSAV